MPEDSPAWPLVTSTNDNCLGSDCPLYKECFVVKARKTAMDADVVVVNHHLFLADMVVKDSGFGELIPEAEVMIFDEAHQLPDIASQYFGQSLSSRQLQDLAKDFTIAYRTELKDTQQLQKCADRLAQSAQDFRLQLGEPGYRGNLRELLADQQYSARAAAAPMMRWSCATTSRSCRWAALRCWMPPLSARRSIVHGSKDSKRSTSRDTATGMNAPRVTSPWP
ncbi:helicase c2 [Enterobacter cancerogenus]|uniref:Helicase c2 n=1 Tax=Enterobacter cancerogenus TaxID=69218 RepID=A0A484W6Q4_9ENTR|nr:helicase c2 [Enterobacter cancerogenus]